MASRLSTIESKTNQLDISKATTTAYKRITGRKAVEIRKRILLRDSYTCAKCYHVFKPKSLEVDHIVPLHMGGSESDENRQTLCIRCHGIKTESEGKERGL